MSKKLPKYSKQHPTENNSFSYINYNKKYIKTSDLEEYIDSYLIRSKREIFPDLQKKIKKNFPLSTANPIKTISLGFKIPPKVKILTKKPQFQYKKINPSFNMRRKIYRVNRANTKIAQSQDVRSSMLVKAITDNRPKSVILKKKISCIIQTDDLIEP